MNEQANCIGTCVDNPFGEVDILIDVIDKAEEISREVFTSLCEIDNDLFREMVEYPNDYEFFKSSHEGKDLWFFTHSATEVFYMECAI